MSEVLDVSTVLHGSVLCFGDEVRITAQLIDTHTGYHLWSEKYDRKPTSIFAIEDEISKAIADSLCVQLVGGGQALVRRGTVDPDAHALYLSAIAGIDRIQRAKLDDLAKAFWYSQFGTREQALASL